MCVALVLSGESLESRRVHDLPALAHATWIEVDPVSVNADVHLGELRYPNAGSVEPCRC